MDRATTTVNMHIENLVKFCLVVIQICEQIDRLQTVGTNNQTDTPITILHSRSGEGVK